MVPCFERVPCLCHLSHHVTINLSVLFISHLPSLWQDPLIIALDAFPHR